MDRFYRNAEASHKASDLNAAAQGYGAALELDPNHLPALNNLAATRAALRGPRRRRRSLSGRHRPPSRRSGTKRNKRDINREGIGRGA